MVVKYVNVCDRCGEEWSQMDETAPDWTSKLVRGHGQKDLCPSCLAELQTMEDTMASLKEKVLDDIVPEWFRIGNNIPWSIKASLYFRAEVAPAKEYEELFARGSI